MLNVPNSVLPEIPASLKIEHEICDTPDGFWHRIIVNGKAGSRESYGGISCVVVDGIAYYAHIPEYGREYPEVFTIQGLPFTRFHRDVE